MCNLNADYISLVYHTNQTIKLSERKKTKTVRETTGGKICRKGYVSSLAWKKGMMYSESGDGDDKLV